VGYKNLEQLNRGMAPFVIPDRAYSEELGLVATEIDNNHKQQSEII
jgi:hypothetical protein